MVLQSAYLSSSSFSHVFFNNPQHFHKGPLIGKGTGTYSSWTCKNRASSLGDSCAWWFVQLQSVGTFVLPEVSKHLGAEREGTALFSLGRALLPLLPSGLKSRAAACSVWAGAWCRWKLSWVPRGPSLLLWALMGLCEYVIQSEERDKPTGGLNRDLKWLWNSTRRPNWSEN